ncbi:hypothetical protein BLNAU_11489 [Blattamonas nauphoetae]|uniref:Secreted protein n=1 Tax=Blattamonas nauphoetae TaxID=2049346 RepID=A0ABQ9XQV3_9EUKA|nr:hypothetical protein BLNAU_11489 [Blattamonas nauphoetae]
MSLILLLSSSSQSESSDRTLRVEHERSGVNGTRCCVGSTTTAAKGSSTAFRHQILLAHSVFNIPRKTKEEDLRIVWIVDEWDGVKCERRGWASLFRRGRQMAWSIQVTQSQRG